MSNHDIIGDPKRSATDTIRGLEYQFSQVILQCLDSQKDEQIYVEYAEDFIIANDTSIQLTQVKDTPSTTVSLNSDPIKKAILSFWDISMKNQCSVSFKFITTSKPAKEYKLDASLPMEGLILWNNLRPNSEGTDIIRNILSSDKYFETCSNEYLKAVIEDLKSFLKNASKNDIYDKLISKIYWHFESSDIEILNNQICNTLDTFIRKYFGKCIPFDFIRDNIFKQLLGHILNISRDKDISKRVWDRQTLYKQVLDILSIGAPSSIHKQVSLLFIDALSNIDSSIFRRKELEQKYLKIVNEYGVLFIYGSIGTGKTTLGNILSRETKIDKWISLKPYSSRTRSDLLHELQQKIIQENTVNSIFLDDLLDDYADEAECRDIISSIISIIKNRKGYLIVTSNRNIHDFTARSLGFPECTYQEIPTFCEKEVESYLLELNCPNTHLQQWTNTALAVTGGNVALINAFCNSLKNKWEIASPINYITDNTELNNIKDRLRIIWHKLPNREKYLSAYLSIFLNPFRETDAIELTALIKQIGIKSKETFKSLSGPWIEPHKAYSNYYTVSQLLKGVDREILTEDERKKAHSLISEAIFKGRKFNLIDISSALFHSIFGERDDILALVIIQLGPNFIENDISISNHLWWLADVPFVRFSKDSNVDIMVRILQYQVATTLDRKNTEEIADTIDLKLKDLEKKDPLKILWYTAVLIGKPVSRIENRTLQKPTQHHLKISRKVKYLENADDIISNNIEIARGLSEKTIADIPALKEKVNTLFLGLPIAIYADEVVSLFEAIDKLNPTTRNKLLVLFEEIPYTLRIALDKIWEATSPNDKEKINEILTTISTIENITEPWKSQIVQLNLLRIKAIIYDEYMNEAMTALALFDKIRLTTQNQKYLYYDTIAKIFNNTQDYNKAYEHYNYAIKYADCIQCNEFNPYFYYTYREAATCAGKLEHFEESSILFQKASDFAKSINDGNSAIACLADKAHVSFMSGKHNEAIEIFKQFMEQFTTLPPPSQSLESLYIIKIVGQIFLHIKGIKEENIPIDARENFYNPHIGSCSRFTNKSKLSDLPIQPMEINWLLLAEIEYLYLSSNNIFNERCLHFTSSNVPLVKFEAICFHMKISFHNSDIANLLRLIPKLDKAILEMKRYREVGADLKTFLAEDLIEDIQLPNESENINAVFVYMTCIARVHGKAILDYLETLTTSSTYQYHSQIEENLNLVKNLFKGVPISQPINNAIACIYNILLIEYKIQSNNFTEFLRIYELLFGYVDYLALYKEEFFDLLISMLNKDAQLYLLMHQISINQKKLEDIIKITSLPNETASRKARKIFTETVV